MPARVFAWMIDHWPRILGYSLLAVFLAFVSVSVFFCAGTPDYYSAKYSGPPTAQRPAEMPGLFVPDVQREGHTCGFHSAAAVYRAYGLDPEAARLRFRLGTDRLGNNLDPESLGTIHPDILRVLGQDGFDTTLLLARDAGRDAQLRDHLASGHPALALIRVEGLHWVVFTAVEGDDVVVCDSLRDGLQRERFADFVPGRVLNAILVKPSQN